MIKQVITNNFIGIRVILSAYLYIIQKKTFSPGGLRSTDAKRTKNCQMYNKRTHERTVLWYLKIYFPLNPASSRHSFQLTYILEFWIDMFLRKWMIKCLCTTFIQSDNWETSFLSSYQHGSATGPCAMGARERLSQSWRIWHTRTNARTKPRKSKQVKSFSVLPIRFLSISGISKCKLGSWM